MPKLNKNSLKCLHCICALETNEGLWCIKLRCIPTKETIQKCKNFVDKRCLKGFENDARK
jgi:hypothetical protein